MHTTDDSISTTCRCREYCESWGAIYSFLCMQIVRIAQFPNDDRSVAKAFSIIYAQFNKNSGRIRTPSDSRTAAAPFIFLWLFSECALARLKWMEKNRTRRAKKIHFLLFAFFLFCFIFSRVTRNLMRTYKNTYHLGADILAAFDAENVIKMNTFLFWCVRLVLLLRLFTFFFFASRICMMSSSLLPPHSQCIHYTRTDSEGKHNNSYAVRFHRNAFSSSWKITGRHAS